MWGQKKLKFLSGFGNIARRGFLKSGLAGVGLAALPGCAAIWTSRELPKGKNQIYVDAHAHIFNADDLAIKGFVQASYPSIISSYVIDKIAQEGAINIKDEEKQISKKLRELDGKEFATGRETTKLSGPALAVRLVHRFTTKRYRNANRLIRTYQHSTPWSDDNQGIDRFVVALVDMDYWLNDFSKSRIDEQIRITEQISRMFPGRLYPFAPFDPLRNIVENGKPLEWVKDAINNHGFVGVKLYPPMGFRPYGNAELDGQENAWPRHFRKPENMKVAKYLRNDDDEVTRIRNRIGSLASRTKEGLGHQLDKQLEELYVWCEDNDVPIMAHANDSNGSEKGFKKSQFKFRASPEHWEKVLKRHKSLRINLGHFGGWEDVVDGKKSVGWARMAVTLMSEYPNVYADLGNFSEIGTLSCRDGLSAGLVKLFSEKDGILKKRLLYASDWFMSVGKMSNEEYFTDFNNFFHDEFRDERDAVMGNNALRFLGPRGKV